MPRFMVITDPMNPLGSDTLRSFIKPEILPIVDLNPFNRYPFPLESLQFTNDNIPTDKELTLNEILGMYPTEPSALGVSDSLIEIMIPEGETIATVKPEDCQAFIHVLRSQYSLIKIGDGRMMYVGYGTAFGVQMDEHELDPYAIITELDEGFVQACHEVLEDMGGSEIISATAMAAVEASSNLEGAPQ